MRIKIKNAKLIDKQGKSYYENINGYLILSNHIDDEIRVLTFNKNTEEIHDNNDLILETDNGTRLYGFNFISAKDFWANSSDLKVFTYSSLIGK